MNVKTELDKFIKNITKNINCLLLRYSSSFLEPGGDIDILVEPLQMKILVKNIIDQAIQNNHHLVKYQFSKYFSLVYVVFIFDNKKYPLYFEIRTVINDYVLTFKDLKSGNFINLDEDGINTLDVNTETAILLVRNFFANRKLSEKHLYIIEGHDTLKVKSIINDLGFDVSYSTDFYGKYFIKKERKSLFKNIYHRFLLKFCSKNKKSPLFISFYGPDGAGKSTYGEMLYEDTKLFKKVYLYHYMMEEEDYIPKEKSETKVKTLMGVKFPILRFLRYMAIKKRTFLRKFKNDVLVINDRFLLDYFFKFYHNTRFCTFHAKVAKMFSNKTDMMNILIVDTPKRIIERKPELTKEQILKIYDFLYKGIKHKSGRFFTVNLAEFENIDDAYQNVIQNISLTNKNIFYKKVVRF